MVCADIVLTLTDIFLVQHARVCVPQKFFPVVSLLFVDPGIRAMTTSRVVVLAERAHHSRRVRVWGVPFPKPSTYQTDIKNWPLTK